MREKPREALSAGDGVIVVDGTFTGMKGVVVSYDEARRVGGQQPPLKPVAGSVSVVLNVFDRPTAINLLASQVAKAQP